MTFMFHYAPEVTDAFPSLVSQALVLGGIAQVAQRALEPEASLLAAALTRLAANAEGEWPEIQAWRRAFSQMGFKPTQYRSAAESLLRRLRKEGSLPQVHPLVDLCNAVSVAHATPIAVFDLACVEQTLTVRRADGSERYLSFSGEIERPEPGEIIFADAAGNAHARRWTHRQSALSAITANTARALIVAEALHADAAARMPRLVADLRAAVTARWPDATISELVLQRGDWRSAPA
ncbi:MAG: hypothetical protein OJF60_001298 [Burkholderiaceae bacterium]|nr:MAG: hypothetical protein OJF60_001298 [Burkholderiaceae bacterium]